MMSVKIILFALSFKSKEPEFIILYLEKMANPNLLKLVFVFTN